MWSYYVIINFIEAEVFGVNATIILRKLLHMNTQLWNSILQFDFDDPISEYGFSTRLAKENYWTKNFTTKAILEYKKFMYLAATADNMVSPSAIVDVVWHQHLIFTQSYSEFCNILGKNIQHIPSTHNNAEAEKFRLAKERTSQLYNETFGEQPPDIWQYDFMLDTLSLSPAKMSVESKATAAVFITAIAAFPFYFLLKPIYVHIPNPNFLIGLVIISIFTFIGLEIYTQNYLQKIVKSWPAYSFIYDLHPSELVYLQKQNLQHVIHGNINQLLQENRLSITSSNTLQIHSLRKSETVEELVITNFLHQTSTAFYSELLRHLTESPAFNTTANTIDNFKNHFRKSKAFGRLFTRSTIVLFLLILIAIVRVMTGLMRDKPVGQICLAVGILVFASYIFLHRLLSLVSTHTIPSFYKTDLLPEKQNTYTWDWQYFLLGSSVFLTAFTPIVGYVNKNYDSATGGSSCGSSCGSGGDGGGSSTLR